MQQTTAGILVETVVRRALLNIKSDPDRSIRNLVDLALNFARGRFQKYFLTAAQTILEKEDSAFYLLLRDAAAHVDTEHLFTFGMNVGYHGCTVGAARIRDNEYVLDCRIPWTIQLDLEQESRPHMSDCHDVIREGEELGVYIWLLYSREDVQPAMELAETHPDSAFCLFCPPEQVTETFLDGVEPLLNLMPVIAWEEGADEACSALRERELLYSLSCPYGPENLETITGESLFRDVQSLFPIFTVLIPEPGCPQAVRRTVYQKACTIRTAQTFRTLPMEMDGDMEYIDHVISDDTCAVRFDVHGSLYASDGSGTIAPGTEGLLFRQNLSAVLQRANPRHP